ALRISYIGEQGWELHHDIDQQKDLLKHLMQAGQKYELGFYGAFAVNSMRLEMGYRAWGVDLTTERTPLEAGLDRFVKTEGRRFVGRESLLTRQSDDDHWSMQLLELEESTFDPFYMHSVFQGDQVVGMVTSGAFGHRLGKPVALAYFRNAVNINEEFSVLILGEYVSARVKQV
ncbi:MAG: aminomethyl transferase family protein, partial [Gammaproteobacteria bacterium]|nr:aminomethyl transferase family protein [Gammaproteobacteria bacterium]